MGASLQIGADVELAAAIGKLTETTERLAEIMGGRGDPNPVRTPLIRKVAAAKVASNTTYNYVQVATPPYGKIWDLRRLSVWGPDPFTAVTGNVFPFISAGVGLYPDSATIQPNLPEIIGNTTTTTIPYRDSWQPGTALLLPQEVLYLVMKSVTNAAVLWVYLQAMEYSESDRAALLGSVG